MTTLKLYNVHPKEQRLLNFLTLRNTKQKYYFMRNLYKKFFSRKASRQNMTSNGNTYYNFLKCFEKKPFSFSEHNLRNTATKYTKHKQIKKKMS